MNNPRLSYRYAKSLKDLAIEMNLLEEVHQDVLYYQRIVKSSSELRVMLKSPIIHSDKKSSILSTITGKNINKLTGEFIKLLCKKKREKFLSGILDSFVVQYNQHKGLHTAQLTTAVPVSDAIKNDFITKIKKAASIEHLELETRVDEKLIGGFVLSMEGKLLDGSILRDLNDVKKQFDNNDYLHRLR